VRPSNGLLQRRRAHVARHDANVGLSDENRIAMTFFIFRDFETDQLALIESRVR
jgi:hypothetical protein